MTPLNHLELFDEFSHCLHWELDKDKLVVDATPTELKQHLIQTVISVLEEEIKEVNKHIDNAERFVPFQKIHHIDGLEQARDSLTTTLSTWQAMLKTTP